MQDVMNTTIKEDLEEHRDLLRTLGGLFKHNVNTIFMVNNEQGELEDKGKMIHQQFESMFTRYEDTLGWRKMNDSNRTPMETYY